jgi:hypothetical protein
MTGWRAARGRLEAGRPEEGCIRVRDGLAALDLASNFKNKNKKTKTIGKEKRERRNGRKGEGRGRKAPCLPPPEGFTVEVI